MQFYTIRPGAQESLPRFHARLIDLADKCDFLCPDCQGSFKGRMIRDRLLISVDKDLRREVLAATPRPSSADILRLYKEKQNVSTFIIYYYTYHSL